MHPSIPTRLGVEAIADTCSRIAAKTSDPSTRERYIAIAEDLRGLCTRAKHAEPLRPDRTDPVVVGYLLAWLRGHSESLPALQDYLDTTRLREADRRDTRGVIFAALQLAGK